ncbi:conjugal transfer protein TraD [Brevundimonas sp. DWR2-3-1b1]|uniref:conjugal transfer protein TraD n=1 Tax=Brevundimonas sp. DWR2-3-1b1 TaxID=2804641 RepID=UPI003CF99513
MRKLRDIDAELRALQDKAKTLKARKVVQLGELVTATGADALDAETLAGILLEALDGAKQPDAQEGWRLRGAAFFQGRTRSRKGAGQPSDDKSGAAANGGGHGAR